MKQSITSGSGVPSSTQSTHSKTGMISPEELFTKDSDQLQCSRYSSPSSGAHIYLSTLLLSLLLSISFIFLLGYYTADSSNEFNFTIITHRLFCSSFANSTFSNPTSTSSSSSLPTSSPSVPVVHATLLEKETVPACMSVPSFLLSSSLSFRSLPSRK